MGGMQNTPICTSKGEQEPHPHITSPCEIGTCHVCLDHLTRPGYKDFLCNVAELSLRVSEHQCGETQLTL